MHPNFLDKPTRCMTHVKYMVGGIKGKVIDQGSGMHMKKHARKGHGSAKSYLDAK